MSNKKNKTQLNPKFRFDHTINARRIDGEPMVYAEYFDENTQTIIRKTMDVETANGGTMTPFNIQCNVPGAPAIRKIIRTGNETIILFADGDRVVLNRHSGDSDDPVTAVLWGLGYKVFGKNLPRQIANVIKYRTIDSAVEHEKKLGLKAFKEAAKVF